MFIAIYTYFLLPLALAQINFQNNACSDILAYPIWFFSPDCFYNPDVGSDVSSMAARNGYSAETHTLTTPDGYILNVFRILPKISNGKGPVFIQYGIISSADIWTDIGEASLAFFLANLGYDVWLGNWRGGTYSHGHVSLTRDDVEYWNFTLDDLAQIDQREQLQLVANITGKGGSIIYIGHSIGSTLSFMLAAGQPQKAAGLLQGIVAISPVLYLKDLMITNDLLTVFQVQGLFYHQNLIHWVMVHVCTFFPVICEWGIYFVGGRSVQFPAEFLLLYFSFAITGISIKEVYQIGQMYRADKFQWYDYGADRNLEAYGTPTPRQYHLSNITIPVHIFFGKNDALSTEPNLMRGFAQLGNIEKSIQPVPIGNDSYAYNHFDFMYSKYLKEFFYKQLVPVLNRFK